jgi:origin recognition complex subunit 3
MNGVLIFRSSWQNRIPVVLLFGIATSIEIFQDRLPRAALLAIQATQFDVVQSDELLERMFDATITGDEDEILIRLGANLASTILQRQRENIQSPQDFINALQVC